jgi:hypothetical protein
MTTLFRALLFLYPAAYRLEYGEEMSAVLAAVREDIAKKAPLAKALAYAREVQGLLRGALDEHSRSLFSPQGSRFYARRLPMRSEFRFPKSTVTLMTLILAAVVMAIEKAKAISDSVPYSSTPVGKIRAEQFTTVSTLLIVLAGMAIAGALLWIVLFALRRSGIQRLSALNPSAEPRAKNSLSS